ncbi:MAG: methyltransferase domain-containing protein [Elusimicrobia bacterium]|nr:methyltransferase domain-containing protein [Elusimicrobiota bacterium]
MTEPTDSFMEHVMDFEHGVSEKFLNTLRCPVCQGALGFHSSVAKGACVSKGSLGCSPCGRNYPIEDGIPHLFVEWVLPAPGSDHPFPQYLLSPAHLQERAKKVGADRIVLSRTIDPRGFFHRKLQTPLTILRLFLWFGVVAALFLGDTPLLFFFGSGFVLDFVLMAYSKRRQYKFELAQLLAFARKGVLHEKDITVSIPDAAEPDFHGRVENRTEEIESVLTGWPFQGKEVLHVGCGGENEGDINSVYLNRGAKLTGLDVFAPGLKTFKKRFKSEGVLAEALRIPFRNEQFDFSNGTDIIEHVHDPFRFLEENWRVLRPGGGLLLITPNRCRARRGLGFVNPFLFFQGVLGHFYPSTLPPLELMCRHRDFIFFHTSFSQKELTTMLTRAGFLIDWVGIKAYRGPGKRFRKKLERIPFLHTLNDSLFVLARKPQVRS